MARGLRGVRDDLSELGRHLLDIACFLHPLLNPSHADSPPPTPTHLRSPSLRPASPPSPSPPRLLAGILSDLAEIGGSLRGSFSRLSTSLPDTPASAAAGVAAAPPSLPAAESPRPPAAAAGDIADDVVDAALDLAARPEAWIEFPVLALDEDSMISNTQRDHIEAVERLAPDLASLRTRLCPSYMDEDVFWKIYFRLLESKLNDHHSEEEMQNVPDCVPHVCEIESEKSVHQEGYQSSDGHALTKTRSEQSIDQWVFTKSRSQQSMDQWSEIPSDVESFREGKRYLSSEDLSDVDGANVVVMEKYMDSLLTDRKNIPYASSSVRRDSIRRKPASSSDYGYRAPQPTQVASLSKKESWDVIEDSEFELLDS